MNSMELVRFPTRSLRPSPSSPAKRLPPPFQTELIGPVRNAIVRGRQLLIHQQQDDGTWLGRQSADVSLASQLIFLLTHLKRDDAELIQQCAATIVQAQQEDGGWSIAPNAPSDVSASVQAYFALKLAGLDPSGEVLQSARHRIRQLGGADAADSNTRFLLALLGQIGYDSCDVRPPEATFVRNRESRLLAPLSLVWSHRPVTQVGIERGIRELFLKKPKEWTTTKVDGQNGRFSRTFNSFFRAAWLATERHGWTPMRRRTLARCESRVIWQTEAAQISDLDFSEIVWHMIALHVIGFGADSGELQRCEKRLREMVHVDDDQEIALPQLRETRRGDTWLAVQSLLVSGLSASNSVVTAAMEAIAESHEAKATRQTADLCNLMLLLRDVEPGKTDDQCALPPELEIWWESQFPADDTTQYSEDRLQCLRSDIESALSQLRVRQNRDGGWSATPGPSRRRTTSDLSTTCNVIEAFCNQAHNSVQPLLERGIAYLRTSQHSDGSWSSTDGRQQILYTSQAIRALLAAGALPDDDAIAAAINWLIVEQQAIGGWCETSNERNTDEIRSSSKRKTSALQTAWALMALVAAGRANDPVTRRGVGFLLDSQGDDGGWTDREWTSYDPASKRWFSNDLHSIAGPLWALSSWAVAAGSTESEPASQLSLRLMDAVAEN